MDLRIRDLVSQTSIPLEGAMSTVELAAVDRAWTSGGAPAAALLVVMELRCTSAFMPLGVGTDSGSGAAETYLAALRRQVGA